MKAVAEGLRVELGLFPEDGTQALQHPVCHGAGNALDGGGPIVGPKQRNATGNAVLVRVRPTLKLVRVAAHRYSLRAVSAETFAGKYVAIQRYNGTKRRWVAVKVVPLAVGKAGVAPSIVTTATFRSTLKTGLRMRATMTQAQVGSCYAPTLSNTIRS